VSEGTVSLFSIADFVPTQGVFGAIAQIKPFFSFGQFSVIYV
jgi:hypothetical protein